MDWSHARGEASRVSVAGGDGCVRLLARGGRIADETRTAVTGTWLWQDPQMRSSAITFALVGGQALLGAVRR